jgi:ABC-2 type transport system permease protein
MSQFATELKSSYAFVERHFNLAKRYFGWELVFLVYTIVNSLTICFIGYTQGKERVLYLVVGAMLWGFLSILFHEISESVSWERWEGTIEYTFMAPVRRFTHLAGMCFYSIIYGIIRTGLLLLAVAIFFSLSLKGANFLAALIILVVSSLSFIGLGLMAAVLPLMSPEKGSQATHIFQAVLLLISGVYYETSILPAWIRPLSVISPATYTLRAMRAALLEGKPVGQMLNTLLLLLAIGLLLIPMGFLIFHQAEIYAKKSGKLKRSG